MIAVRMEGIHVASPEIFDVLVEKGAMPSQFFVRSCLFVVHSSPESTPFIE